MSELDRWALQAILYLCFFGTWAALVLSSLREPAGCLLMLLFGWFAGLVVALVVGFVVALLMAFGLFWPALVLLGVLFLLGIVAFFAELAQTRAEAASGTGAAAKAPSPADLTRPALPPPAQSAEVTPTPESSPPPTSSAPEEVAFEAPSLPEFRQAVVRLLEDHLRTRGGADWGVALAGGRLHFVPTLGREPLVLALEERSEEYRFRIHSPRKLRFRGGRAYRSVRKPWAGGRTPTSRDLAALHARILEIVDEAIDRYRGTAHKRPVGDYTLTDVLFAVWMYDLFRGRKK